MSAPRPVPSAPVALAPGDTLPEARIGPLTRTDVVRYAGAGGDFNPIHHDEPMAVAAGMPGTFAMGLLHAGMLGIQLARWVGVAGAGFNAIAALMLLDAHPWGAFAIFVLDLLVIYGLVAHAQREPAL